MYVVVKGMLGGRIALKVYVKKRSEIADLVYLKKSEKVNKRENKIQSEKPVEWKRAENNLTKQLKWKIWFFEKIDEIDKLLAMLIRKKGEGE